MAKQNNPNIPSLPSIPKVPPKRNVLIVPNTDVPIKVPNVPNPDVSNTDVPMKV
jgi:hypothetical protein